MMHLASALSAPDDAGSSTPNSPVLTAALDLAARGLPVFPVNREKKPLAGMHGFKDATRDEAVIRGWFTNAPGRQLAVAAGGGLLVIDLDCKHGADGVASLAALEARHSELPEAPCVRTPSGGLHIWLSYDPALDLRCSAGRLGAGIDVRASGGYVVAPPSVVTSGGGYVWEVDLDDCTPPPAPEWLIGLIMTPARAEACPDMGGDDKIQTLINESRQPGKWHSSVLRLTAHLTAIGVPTSAILAMAAEITLKGYTVEQTRAEIAKMIEGARAKGWMPHPPCSDETLDALLASGERKRQKAAQYDGGATAEDDEAARTAEDDSDDSGDAECGDDAKAAINARTSAKRAWARGEPPAKAVRRIRKNWPDLGADAEEIVRKAYADMQKYAPGKPYFEGLKQKTIVDMNFMNARFGFLNAPGNQSAIACCADATLVARADFAARLAPKVILAGIGKKGEPVFEPAATFWIESDERRVFNKIAFTSRQVPTDTFNLWTGFAVTPKAGQCSLIKEHISEVICAGNRVAFAAMMNLIAWQLQNVGKPSKVVPVLISQQQQVGKGVFVEQLLMPILGSAHSYTAKTTKEITGNFNSAALKGKVIVFMDETLFRGDKQTAALIKGLITTERTPLNEKFLPAVTMPVGLNVWAASNNPNPVHVEECDARYWILDVSEHRYGDYNYFGALTNEIENGGREAFLAEMLARDVSNFIPQRDIPRDTAAHARVKVASYAPSDPRNWLLECAEAGGFVGWQIDGQGDVRPDWFYGAVISAGKMMQAYRHWVTETRGPNIATCSASDFWAAMSAAGFAKQKKKYGVERVCPNPDACIDRIKAGDVVATAGYAD